ncbi:MAG: hypothetical protein ACOYXT_08170 [Bacteroidota bacterium]
MKQSTRIAASIKAGLKQEEPMSSNFTALVAEKIRKEQIHRSLNRQRTRIVMVTLALLFLISTLLIALIQFLPERNRELTGTSNYEIIMFVVLLSVMVAFFWRTGTSKKSSGAQRPISPK